ncbi:MAG: ATP synthase F1 subunit delta [Anaerovoracaceae bacterium]|jgi:F-type H+-transporting ATPase subunit delta|nr:ATP synthase F1 subunit delta [Bacillota bacterium]MDY2670854.1 ATP synthase F1 subunit delta [Anaerovoracaceae bacterium]
MTSIPDNYARVLFDLNLDPGDIETARVLLTESKELTEALTSPIISRAEKRVVIDKLFPESIRDFIKVMSDYGDVEFAEETFSAYDALVLDSRNAVSAEFAYVTEPDDAQISRLKQKIAKDYNKDSVELNLVEDKSLIGGFVLTVGDYVLDQSVKTSIQKLRRHFAER